VEGVVTINGIAGTVILPDTFKGCTSISAVKIISQSTETYTGNIFSGCTGIKVLEFAGSFGLGLNTFDVNNAIPSVTEVIFDVGLLANNVVNLSGLSGLRKMTVKQTLNAIVAATFPTHAEFDTLEIRDGNQAFNAAIFSTLPTSVKNVIIGTGPAPGNGVAAPGYVPLDIGSGAASLFNAAVNKITFTGGIGTLGTSTFVGLENFTVEILNGDIARGGADAGVIPNYTFNSAEIVTVKFGAGVTDRGEGNFDSIKLKEFVVDGNNKNYSTYNNDGVLYSKKDGALNTLIQYPKSMAGDKYVIPDGVGVVAIGDYAFLNVAALKEITIPKSIKSIGDNVWASTNLTKLTYAAENASNGSVFPATIKTVEIVNGVVNIPAPFLGGNANTPLVITIPESVRFINATAFSTTTGITTVNFNATDILPASEDAFKDLATITAVNIGSKVKNIPGGTFSGTKIRVIKLGSVIESIGAEAFKDCDELASVDIPVTCTVIGSEAFDGCDQMTDVTIHGTDLAFPVDAFNQKGVTTGEDLWDVYKVFPYTPTAGGPGVYTWWADDASNCGWKKAP
jgi:hypothetical protein